MTTLGQVESFAHGGDGDAASGAGGLVPLSGSRQQSAARRLELVRAGELSADTAQTSGMRRFAAVCAGTVGSQELWMGLTRLAPGASSGTHHHGESETAIYVVSGQPAFVFVDSTGDGSEVRLEPSPGDFVFVPPFVAHREENLSADTEAVVVIARSTQEAIVVNLEDRPRT